MALEPGARVVLRNPSRVRKGWRKLRRTCTACSGAGVLPTPNTTEGVMVCGGCNGHGYVLVWQQVK